MTHTVVVVSTEKSIFPWIYITMFSCGLLALDCGLISGWNEEVYRKIVIEFFPPITLNRLIKFALIGFFSLGVISGLVLLICHGCSETRRKTRLLVAALPALASWSICVLATNRGFLNWKGLIATTVLFGVTVGLTEILLPIYVGEISGAKSRGKSCISLAFWHQIGTVVFSAVLTTSMTYHRIGIACLAALAVYVILFAVMPSSPYFLVLTGQIEKAASMVTRLIGDANNASANLAAIEQTVEVEKSRATGGCSISCDGVNGKALKIMLLLAVCSECGGGPLTSLAPQLMFTLFLLPNIHIRLYVTVTKVITLLLAMSLIDTIGRRPMIQLSASLAALGLAGFALLFAFKESLPYGIESYYNVGLGLLVLFTFAMTFGLTTVPLVLISELFPTDARLSASATFVVWREVLTVLVSFIHLIVGGPYKDFVMLTIHSFMLISVSPVITKLLPETRGKTFMEIQNSLGKR